MSNNIEVPDIEAIVLGSILYENNSIEKTNEILSTECFNNANNRKIYSIMLKLYNSNLPIDTISVYEEIKREKLKELISVVYLSKLTELIFSTAKLEYYCKILYEKWFARKICSILVLTMKQIKEDSEDIFKIHSRTISALENIGDDFASKNTIEKNLWEDLPEYLDIIEKRASSGEGGLKSISFPSFNIITGGLREGDLVCAFGKYKGGKSTFALQLAIDFALDSHVPVGIISLEMDKESLYHKALSMRTGIDYQKLRNPKDNDLTPEIFQPFQANAIRVFKESKIYIADNIFDKNKIKLKMRVWKKLLGIKFFVVDYLGLVLTDQKAERRDLQIAEISRFFKLTAKELKTTILILAQENENGTTAESKAPMRDADFVFRVSKPREEGNKNFSLDDHLIQLLHSRHGKNGWSFKARFIENNFVELAPEGTNNLN